MFYIVPYADLLDANKHAGYNTLEAAIQYAERMHHLSGKDYSIMSLEWAGWSTKTLADRPREATAERE
jgi:hypothetical protein